jgi:hypothetical protein
MDELTKKALQAQSKEKQEQTKSTKSTNTTESAEQNDKSEEIEKTEETFKNKFVKASELITDSNEIRLGENKIVTIRPWTGKTKKKFRKIFEFVENPEDIDFERVVDVLLYASLNKGKDEIYLNEGEQQFLISVLTTKSIDDKMESTGMCPKCSAENKFKINVLQSTYYKENEFPQNYNKDIDFVDIKSFEDLTQTIEKITQSDEYDGITTGKDIETAMHIKVKDLSTEEIIEYLDNMGLKDIEKLMNSLEDILPHCELKSTQICKSCGQKSEFTVDFTASMFEALLK